MDKSERIHSRSTVFALLSVGGIITGLSYALMQWYLAWICLVPLFYVLDKAKPGQSILYGASYGAIVSLIFFAWMISVASRYSGGFTLLSVPLYFAAIIYFTLYFVAFAIGYRALCRRTNAVLVTGGSAAAYFVLLEFVKVHVLPGLPWLQYNLAITQAKNAWNIQLASVGGLYIIIFFIVLFNFLLTQYILRRRFVSLEAAIGVVLLFFCVSSGLRYGGNRSSVNTLRAVLLNENISAETRWNDSTGDSLAGVFFTLNEQAARYNPDIIVWSEAAIPWRLEPDDQFIPRILTITRKSKAAHLIGIFSPSVRNGRMVYNSSCLFRSDGAIADRYDKSILLDFLEQPLVKSAPYVLRFVNASRYSCMLPGRSRHVLGLGEARMGVMICNESLCEEIYSDYVDAGANVLVATSNDAWFENTPLQRFHFYITRLEAVVWGKDILINSNRGIVGLARANGEIEMLPPSGTPRTVCRAACLSDRKTFYSLVKNAVFPFYLLIVFFPFLKKEEKR